MPVPASPVSARPGLSEMDAWQRARLRLESDLKRPVSVEMVARDLGVTPDYFTRRFRRRFGIGPHTCRTHAKLREALSLLRQGGAESGGGGEPVKTVAYRLGFNNPKAFARLFKRHLGLNPSQVTTAVGGADEATSPAGAKPPIELFPGNTHVLPADRATIAPFAELTTIVATSPPPFPPGSILYRRPR
jgi:AraC-like DNA-binding protein